MIDYNGRRKLILVTRNFVSEQLDKPTQKYKSKRRDALIFIEVDSLQYKTFAYRKERLEHFDLLLFEEEAQLISLIT